MNIEKFMDFFRSEKFDETASIEQRKELFLQCLLGSSDITVELLNELLEAYCVENIKIKKVSK